MSTCSSKASVSLVSQKGFVPCPASLRHQVASRRSVSLQSQANPFRCSALVQPKRGRATCGLKVQASAYAGPGSGLAPELKETIDKLIGSNQIVVFMKGVRTAPQCGFSNSVVQILNVMGAKYETVNILDDPRLRTGMKEYSQWPTFPQVYIDGEFYGGADILMQSYQSGELKELMERLALS